MGHNIVSVQLVKKLKRLLSVFGRNFVVFEVVREDEFSPLKNADGAATDSPTTARNSLLAQHFHWAIAAGATLLDGHGNTLPPTARSEADVLFTPYSNRLCQNMNPNPHQHVRKSPFIPFPWVGWGPCDRHFDML